MTDLVLWKVLRKTREARKLSQRKVAALTGIAQPQVSLYESGKVPVPEQALRRVADAYGVTERDLLLEGLAEESTGEAKKDLAG